MDDITPLFELDWSGTISNILIILIAVVAIVAVVTKFGDIIGKPIKWFKRTDEQSNQIAEAVKDLKELTEEHKQLMNQTTNNTRELVKLASEMQGFIEAKTKQDEEIESIVYAEQRILADRINQLCKRYMELGGIPEDELDEFVELHKAYKLVHGNHGTDVKVEYCTEHLPVIPVETRLKMDKNRED